MLNYRTKSGGMRFSLLPVLMGFLLMGILGITTSYGQEVSVDTVGSMAQLVVQLQNKSVQDSVIMPTFKVVVTDTLAYTSDSVAITLGKFKFANSGPYKVEVSGGMTVDSARISPLGDTLYIGITGDPGNYDTLTISGVYIYPNHTFPVFSDNSTTDFLKMYIVDGANIIEGKTNPTVANGHSVHNFGYTFVILPGPIYNAAISAEPAGSVAAGSAIIATLSFTDYFGNVPNDAATNIGVTAVLASNGTSPGNGILTGQSVITKNVVPPTTDTYTWTGLEYTKAESIQLVFTAPGNTVTSSSIAITPGPAESISVALQSGKSNTFTVDQNTAYTLTITDKYSNLVSDTSTVAAIERTAHGGSFVFESTHTTGGQINVTFNPDKYFIGADTLVFSSPSVGSTATQMQVVMIELGSPGGLIVDYAGTVNGDAITEQIAAGTTVYVRAFLIDPYGNPINASSASEITFSIESVLGNGASLGTAVLTNAITEPQYPNANKTAIGVAIPFTISTNVRATQDTIVATNGSLTGKIAIQNRSNVPTKIEIHLSSGADNSVIASDYSNSIEYTDVAWDEYGNLSIAPSSSVVLAPTRSSYAIYFSTDGLIKFVRSSDRTTADTLYPNSNGQVTRTVSSSKTTGIDILKTWSASSNSISTQVIVTPAAFAALVIMPDINTPVIAGQQTILAVEKQDEFGNHIDWGVPGNQTITDYKTAYYTGDVLDTNNKLNPAINAELAALQVDTVTTNMNRGGWVDATKKAIRGASALASVGGTLVATFPFTAFTLSADTQKVYASLGGLTATLTIYSVNTGLLRSFEARIAESDSVHFAGDSVAVTFTALDSLGHRVYSYSSNGHTLALSNTSVSAIATMDTTYYFSYINSHNEYVKSTGLNIQDTVFNQGQAIFYLHKFVVDSENNVSIEGGGISATALQGLKFMPLAASTAFGYWLVTAPDTLKSIDSFSFTVTPRDKYYNVNNTEQINVNISSNQTSGFNIGSNPKVITGPTVFDGTLSGAKGNMILYVFDNTNSSIFAESSPIAINVLNGIENTNSLPKEYALLQNYPNPFNPTTLIKYDLPKAGLVTLKVYDLLGREVATLINRNQAAGKYSVQFNASKLASGVYIYRIESNNFSAVKKLMLLK